MVLTFSFLISTVISPIMDILQPTPSIVVTITNVFLSLLNTVINLIECVLSELLSIYRNLLMLFKSSVFNQHVIFVCAHSIGCFMMMICQIKNVTKLTTVSCLLSCLATIVQFWAGKGMFFPDWLLCKIRHIYCEGKVLRKVPHRIRILQSINKLNLQN